MSQLEPTDLLCRSRREVLSAEEQRRLNESLKHSLEVALMSQILGQLESESRVRPGDDALLARITAGALGSPQKAARKRRPLTMLLVAAAVLLMASLASALIGRAREVRGSADSQNFFSDWHWKVAKRGRPRSVLPSVKPMPTETVRVEPDPRDMGDARALASAEPQASSQAPSSRAESEPRKLVPPSASELFARANLLRRQGRGGEAAGLYKLLLELYPNAREVAPSRLALAKHLQATQPEQALAQYRVVANGGSALRAEALWGISEVATGLGQRSLAEQALADLLREFPDSPYAEVARGRTTHGLP